MRKAIYLLQILIDRYIEKKGATRGAIGSGWRPTHGRTQTQNVMPEPEPNQLPARTSQPKLNLTWFGFGLVRNMTSDRRRRGGRRCWGGWVSEGKRFGWGWGWRAWGGEDEGGNAVALADAKWWGLWVSKPAETTKGERWERRKKKEGEFLWF